MGEDKTQRHYRQQARREEEVDLMGSIPDKPVANSKAELVRTIIQVLALLVSLSTLIVVIATRT